ncbi:MAG: hypothetical protein Kow00127_22100 [Bacteroidales bacterium]
MEVRFIILAMVLGLFSLWGQGQNVEFTRYNFPDDREGLSEALRRIREGDKLWNDGNGWYREAMNAYEAAYIFNPDNALLNYKLGRCSMMLNDKSGAIEYFERALSLDPRIDPSDPVKDVYWYLGQAYHQKYRFDKAIENYNIFRSKLSPEELAEWSAWIDLQIGNCNWAAKAVKEPVRVSIENLGQLVNSAYNDYRPQVIPEEEMIFFTSTRESSTGGKRDKEGFYFEDIFVTEYDGRWNTPTNNWVFNSAGNDASAGISADGMVLFIYKSSGGNALYRSDVVGDLYQVPVKMESSINKGFKQTSATLSFDKSLLLFTSERPDSYGGLDIYMTRRTPGGSWSEPENVGAALNTPFDEEGLFLSVDGKTLYFSSKGHKGMGGYDIFRSRFENGAWQKPENMGYPVNTPSDDLFFTQGASGVRGYFSSNREGGYGGHDLYMITFLEEAKPMEMAVPAIRPERVRGLVSPVPAGKIELNIVLSGTVRDAVSGKPLQASVEVYDNVRNQLLASFSSEAETGKYLISLEPGRNYGITVSSKGYLFHSENFNLPEDARAVRIQKDIMLQPVKVGSSIVLNNIFFDFNKATLRDESKAELEQIKRVMEENPQIRIEISGHTDNIGSAAYNQKLSEQRAQAVVQYLIAAGVSPDRMEYKGYGMSQPVASNDTEEGRQKNRRTEFKIIED